MNKIADCKLHHIKTLSNVNGDISIIDKESFELFNVERIFYLYDVPSGESRGAHAHKKCHQFLIAVSGAFEVLVDDGYRKEVFKLHKPNVGLHIPPGIWASEINFSGGSICMVLASHKYEAEDYIRDYSEFLKIYYEGS